MKVTASYARTVQIRQYEPARVIAALEADIPDDADPMEEYRKLFEMCRVLVNEPTAAMHRHDTRFRERD